MIEVATDSLAKARSGIVAPVLIHGPVRKLEPIFGDIDEFDGRKPPVSPGFRYTIRGFYFNVYNDWDGHKAQYNNKKLGISGGHGSGEGASSIGAATRRARATGPHSPRLRQVGSEASPSRICSAARCLRHKLAASTEGDSAGWHVVFVSQCFRSKKGLNSKRHGTIWGPSPALWAATCTPFGDLGFARSRRRDRSRAWPA
jgi:hypothetical protein